MKKDSSFLVWLLGSALLMLMFFQNCGKKSASYDVVNGSSNSPQTTSGQNFAMNCVLSSNTVELSSGQTVVYQITPSGSLAAGYRVFWEGSRTDVDGSNFQMLPAVGFTSTLNQSVAYDTSISPGFYTYSVRVQSAGGEVYCNSNTVRVLFKNPSSTSSSSTTTTNNPNPLYTSKNCPNGTVSGGFCYVTFETKDLTGQNAYYVDGYTFASLYAKPILDSLCASKSNNLAAEISATSPTCAPYPITYANGGQSLVPVYGNTVMTSSGPVPFAFRYQNTWRLSTSITNWSSSPVQGSVYCRELQYLKTLTCRSKTAQ